MKSGERMGRRRFLGGVSEWMMEIVSKTIIRLWRIAGSNPAASATSNVPPVEDDVAILSPEHSLKDPRLGQ